MTNTFVHDPFAVGRSSFRKSTTTATSLSSLSSQHSEGSNHVTYILYLIRHGEAAHNILEKAAMKKAKEEAIAAGYDPDSEQVHDRMEVARQNVLDDPALFDPALSQHGRIEAQLARKRLEELLQSMPDLLSEPTEVLVSPLQRALQTAEIIFPPSSHVHIHIREELRERETGKPPDTCSSCEELRRRRNNFQLFTFSRQLQLSIAKLDFPYFGRLFGGGGANPSGGGGSSNQEQPQQASRQDGSGGIINNNNDENDTPFHEEDKSMLRHRTHLLFSLLPESHSQHVAVVTHKGYLRELEHGPMGQRNTAEFQNCEIRVYKVTFSKGGSEELDAVERIV